MTTPEKAVKQLKFWIVIALTVAGGGFGSAMYLNRYARASDVDDVNNKISQQESRLSAVEAQSRNLEEDVRQFAAQLFEVARAVGARQIPLPDHRKENP